MKERGILMSAPMVTATLREVGPKEQTRRAMNPQPDSKTWFETASDGSVTWNNEGAPCCGTGVWEVPQYSGPAKSPYGVAGDRLWVRETFFAYGRWETRLNHKKGRDEWHFVDMTSECDRRYVYAVDDCATDLPLAGKRSGGVTPGWWKRPAIFMPRAASRVTLQITNIRVERLQEISESDALAEGITCENVIVGAANHGGHHHEISADRYYFDGCDDEGFETGIEAYAALWEQINGADSWEANQMVWVVEFKRITP